MLGSLCGNECAVVDAVMWRIVLRGFGPGSL